MYVNLLTTPNRIEISDDNTNNIEVIDAAKIKEIVPVFVGMPTDGAPDVFPVPPAAANSMVRDWQNQYGHATVTVINLVYYDDRYTKLDLQAIVNQPTWSDGTQGGVNQAVTDITALLQ